MSEMGVKDCNKEICFKIRADRARKKLRLQVVIVILRTAILI